MKSNMNNNNTNSMNTTFNTFEIQDLIKDFATDYLVEEAKAIGIQIPFTSLLIDFAEIA